MLKKFEFESVKEAEEALLSIIENPPQQIDELRAWAHMVKVAAGNYRAFKAKVEENANERPLRNDE